MPVGDWWRHGVFYQIYPRSFQDSNGDGIGDLPGIVTRLDHLNDGTTDSLGIDAIWLSPFYPSPMADFGYDITDYCDVHPDYGTLADFDALVEAAHARGIRVLVDFVPNHTSDRHPWFVESRSSRANPRRDWYVWRDPGPDGSPPNNWRSTFARVGPAWTFDPPTGQSYLHSFLPQQPDLDWWNPAVRRAMDEVLRFWLDRGVDGFRIDVAQRLARDPELRDNPDPRLEPDAPRRDEDWPEVHRILRGFGRTVRSYGERMTVGEVWVSDPVRLARYFGDADELDLVFDFTFLRQPWDAAAFRAATDRMESALPPGAWPSHTLSNHDHSRARTRYDPGDGLGEARARVAAMLLLTLRGTPFLYYGEEIGMGDVALPPGRRPDVDDRDPERTPMQWEPGPGAGFTTGAPWLPVAPDGDRVNVAAQRADPGSLLSLYRRLVWHRRRSAALHAGAYRPIAGTPGGIFAFERRTPGERRLVVLNFEPTPRLLDLSVECPSGRLELATDPTRPSARLDLRRLEVAPNEGLVIQPDG